MYPWRCRRHCRHRCYRQRQATWERAKLRNGEANQRRYLENTVMS